ncbi:hypothetical protein [Thalassobaculum sp.]|uniref:hypothetical protein n=1 Tax=Thalassobaculum sp. TaxID=2022740 RepID=UPI0032EFF01B
MLAPVSSKSIGTTLAVDEAGANRPVRPSSPPIDLAALSTVRHSRPDDRLFLTVEPDGRDDIGFLDRLRHALRTVFEAVQTTEEADASAERALQAAEKSLDPATLASNRFFVQLRVVSVEVAYADEAGRGDSAYASYRRLGIEIGVAREGVVRADDTSVVDLEGRSVELTRNQVLTGLSSGIYRRVEGAGAGLSSAASERLATAQAGLARVKAIQGALKAYRSGDADPLKQLLNGDDSRSGGRSAVVFPGIGAVTLN